MYKKLMFLISLVMLLGLSSPVLSADLEVAWPDTYTVSGEEEYGDMDITGTVIVPSGTTLIMNDESDLSGNGLAEGGMEGASIIVYGTFIMHNRLNMGKGEDAYLIIYGGIVEHDGDKVTVPDDSGGEHRIIIINGGSMVAEEIEIIHDRDAKVILGCNATIEVCKTDEDDSRDPDRWLTDGDLLCHASCPLGVMTVTDLGGNCKEAICLLVPEEAWGPTPKDGAVGQVVTVDLEWKAGSGTILKHVVYFGSSYAAVDGAGLADPECRGTGEVGGTATDFDLDVDPPLMIPAKPAVHLELWKTYYWRVDTWRPAVTKGNVWSFTTGCALDPGDINKDCLVNLLDYAMLADDWRDTSFFPSDM